MGGMVILPIREYRRLIEQSIPTRYLTGKAAKDTDTLIKSSLLEHQQAKTRKIGSLADLD